MNQRTCKDCGYVGPEDDFPAHRRYPGGRINRCRPCEAARVTAYRTAKRQQVRPDWIPRKQLDPSPAVLRRRKWRERHPDKQAEQRKRWRAQYPERYKAHAAVYHAVFRGELVPATDCMECGTKGPVEGHHNDYSKPLEVRWLCQRCHKAAHTATMADEPPMSKSMAKRLDIQRGPTPEEDAPG